MSEPRKGRRLFLMAPIDEDGLCTGCDTKPTRETGRCRCITGVATRYIPPEAEAAAGPRHTSDLRTEDERCTVCREEWPCAEAAAGPREAERRCKNCRTIETFTQTGHCWVCGMAEAAAGPRDAGLDVERLYLATLTASWPGGIDAFPSRDAAFAIAREYAALVDTGAER